MWGSCTNDDCLLNGVADMKVSATWKQEERKEEKGLNAERPEETQRGRREVHGNRRRESVESRERVYAEGSGAT